MVVFWFDGKNPVTSAVTEETETTITFVNGLFKLDKREKGLTIFRLGEEIKFS